MRTILFANEFGTGLGHINHLIALAQRLREHHRLVFALADTVIAAPVIQRAFGSDAILVQGTSWAPLPEVVAAQGTESDTFADVLNLFGFGDVARLQEAQERWWEIVEREKPSLVIADFAPSLRLALEGRVPTVVVGSGYSIMPPGRPLPPIRPWMSVAPDRSHATEANLCSAVNSVRSLWNGPPLRYLSDLFQGDATFVCTIQPFDPYRAFRPTPTFWPYVLPDVAPGPPMKERTGPDVFVYLPSHHWALPGVISALNQSNLRSHMYLSGADPREIANRCKSNIGIMTRPADFSQVLPQVKAVIHHAGLATAYACLAAGTPHLVLPAALEHSVTAYGLSPSKTSICIRRYSAPSAAMILDALGELITGDDFVKAATGVAWHFTTIERIDTAKFIIDACRSYMNLL